MTHLPFARKYRPQTFEDLLGQSHVTTTLMRAITTKRVGQAYLFAGQRGVGKTSAARILAKCLNCVRGPAPKPCQRCPSCLAITQGSSLDVIEIDGASNRGIDEIRNLRETVKFAPAQGAYRLYIIDEVHMLTSEAFNALLKTLEEPPAHVKFILATTAPNKVLPTILSRCQRFYFRRLDAKTIVKALEQLAKTEHVAVDEPALYAIARTAEGSLRDAEVILEQMASFCEERIGEPQVSQLLGSLEEETLLSISQALIDQDASAALQRVSQHLDEGKEASQVLLDLLGHLRNLLIVRTASHAPSRKEFSERLLDVPPEHLKRLEEQAKHLAVEELVVMAQLLAGAYELARKNPFAQVILELTLIKLATRGSWISLDRTLEQFEQLLQTTPQMTAAPTNAQVPSPNLPASPFEPHQILQAPPSAPPPPPSSSERLIPSEDLMELEQVRARWPQVLERIAQKKMSLAAYLTHATPLEIAGPRLQVGLQAFALHHEVLNLPEHVRLIEQVLVDIYARPLSIAYTILPETPQHISEPSVRTASPLEKASEPPPSTMPPIVQDIVHLFNATVVPTAPPRSGAPSG